MKKHTPLRQITKVEQYSMISLGIILMAAGFHFFLIPLRLVAGGVTGLGIVLEHWFEWDVSIFVYILNGFLLILGLLVLGKRIFLRSIYGSILFPTVLLLLERFVPVVDLQGDYVIGTVFGGALVGIGFGLMLKYGGTSGGTDIPVKILNKKFNVPISTSVYLFDGIIVSIGILAFLNSNGLVVGLYALISIYISGRLADVVVVGSNSKKAMQIITNHPDEIKEAIFASVSRGVTVMNIKGGYTGHDKIMLVTVITRREYYLIRNIIASIDDEAFVYVTPATEIHGDFIESESDA
ncbi:YitT family protein [Candidatus Xianfuyuplasma coldseepsis]|uniref:YitT family protein n=1 Tax=Candidatus Xianfuyuplasma coldseepsis TaxID=2782163 RepID=A0A7L7KNP9_9MOLU|nr:YitT family protein [Xianfuyuplasma coldseepsis]QMS84303.1 YitT family protein [Xianfuyuplasma coldseepsis]